MSLAPVVNDVKVSRRAAVLTDEEVFGTVTFQVFLCRKCVDKVDRIAETLIRLRHNFGVNRNEGCSYDDVRARNLICHLRAVIHPGRKFYLHNVS